MEIEFLGANCFRIKTKSTTIIVDDNLASIGGKSPQNETTVALYTCKDVQGDTKSLSRLVIDTPGEFEVGDITVTGAQARSHMDEDSKESATVFQFMLGGQTVTVLGHIHPEISASVAELIGGTDVLVIPVGGNGYTLDPIGAAGVIKKVEPGVVIPSQYEIPGLNYEMPAQPVEEFLKIMPASEAEPQTSFKLAKSELDAATQTKVVVLDRVQR